MASNQAKPKGSRWGSLLSGAVAGLESRLDNIFAEEEERAAKERALARDGQQQQQQQSQPASGTSTPANARLKERLAKAVAKPSSQPSSEPPSRTGTPLNDTLGVRGSADSRRSVEIKQQSAVGPEKTASSVDAAVAEAEPRDPSETLLTSGLPINPARLSHDAPSSPLLDETQKGAAPSIETNGEVPASTLPLTDESDPLEPAEITPDLDTERDEEMHAHLERIDALQAKLQYLARETVAAAREANASARPASLEQKIAEKDQRIAQLMEEGNKLSKTEMRQLAIIKKFRVKVAEEEAATSALQKRLSKLEQSEAHLKEQLQRAEENEAMANDRLKRLTKVEKDLETARQELESSKASVNVLRKQLSDAEKRADEAESAAKAKISQVDTTKVSELQELLLNLRNEKKATEERLEAEAKQLSAQMAQQKEKHALRETELMAEVSNMESRVEALRSRAEEATTDVASDSQAKLLRQLETSQTQYSLAAENWRTIEASLNGRIASIEKERDEFVRREAEMRKKARDMSGKYKRAEEELEQVSEESQSLARQVTSQTSAVKALEKRLAAAEQALSEAKTDFDRQRVVLESEFQQKVDEEKLRQARQAPGLGINTDTGSLSASRTQSPTNLARKSSAQDTLNLPSSRRGMYRVSSYDQNQYPASRRPSALVMPPSSSPGISRQSSGFSLAQLNGANTGLPPTPSINATGTADDDDDGGFDSRSSPQRTMNDVLSASTVHTGPSVQLVERMSSSIRRLESEKAAHKDELARLTSQRDESRNEVVALMREADAKKQVEDKASKLEEQLAMVTKRYEACLDMLGEKEEEVDELRGDVAELKKIYRELADRSLK
ncbi:hypothetical protein AAFC00_005385 [Neodothiora populina]|uniref:TATA element modulatory factor 1 TATA binding domain-containing protein n=1 Tax=Neodothiora populina TaxID=2781224 RepID=A0ABR3PKP8_9PEZI